MRRQIRLNDRADADLMALFDAGYSLGAMLRDILIYKKKSQNLFIYVNKSPGKSLTRFARINMSIPDEIIPEGIASGSFSGFCKTILRNAIFPLPLTPYVSIPAEDTGLEKIANALGAISAERYQAGAARSRMLYSPSPPKVTKKAPERVEKAELPPPSLSIKSGPEVPLRTTEEHKEDKMGTNDLLAMFDAM